jgi:hypothetical protein
VVTNSGTVALGSPLTFTATVSGPAGAATPAGKITWQVSGTAGATACTNSTTTLSSGTATCTINATQAGTYAVSDGYHGNGNYTAATSNTDTVTVTPLGTRAALTSSVNPSTYGQSVTFTVTVSPTDGGGTVSFTAGGTAITGCSARPLTLVSGSYQATCTTSALAAGNHTIRAAYSGDTNYSGSSAAITQTVSQKPTATGLTSGTNPSTYGQAVTFTATVSPTDGGGTVSFSVGTGTARTPICAPQSLSRAGGSYQARCTVSTLPAGTDTITATYSGDTDYGRSSATAKQTVNKTPTATAVTSSKNPSRHGQPVTFTATVSPTDGSGTVTYWYAGNTITGCTSVPLKNNAGTYTAACTTSALPIGTDKIRAVYSGDRNCFGSTGTLTQVVSKTATR